MDPTFFSNSPLSGPTVVLGGKKGKKVTALHFDKPLTLGVYLDGRYQKCNFSELASHSSSSSVAASAAAAAAALYVIQAPLTPTLAASRSSSSSTAQAAPSSAPSQSSASSNSTNSSSAASVSTVQAVALPVITRSDTEQAAAAAIRMHRQAQGMTFADAAELHVLEPK